MALRVEITSNGGNDQQQVAVTGQSAQIAAQAGSRYRVIDDNNPESLAGAKVLRVGDDLVITTSRGQTIQITDFYFVCRFDFRSCFLELDTLGGRDDARVDAEEDPVNRQDDGSFLVWAAPPVLAATPSATAPIAGSASESASSTSTVPNISEDDGMSWGTIAALVGGAVLVGAAAGGGGGDEPAPVGSDPAAPNNPDPGNPDPGVGASAPFIKTDQVFDSATPTISGTAEPGATIQLTLSLPGGAVSWSAVTDNAGDWAVNTASAPVNGSFPPAGLPNGMIDATAVAIDAAGNSSAPAQATLSVATPQPDDTTPPAAPIVDAVTGDDLISVQEAAGPVVISGQAEPGSNVTVIWNGVSLTTSALANGSYAVSFPAATVPAPGAYAITVRATDAAGNVSADTVQGVVVQGASGPAISASIGGAIDNEPQFTGAIADGAVTNDATPEIIGSLDRTLLNGEQVRILRDGQDVGEARVNGTDFSFQSGQLADGNHSFAAVVLDSSGQSVAQSANFSISVDTVAPALPVFDRVEGDSVVDVAEALDGVQITGTAQPGQMVAVSWGQETLTGPVQSDGSYELTFQSLPQGVGYGQSEIVVTALDEAGNAGPGRLREVWVEIRPGDLVAGDGDLFSDPGSTASAQATYSESGMAINGGAVIDDPLNPGGLV